MAIKPSGARTYYENMPPVTYGEPALIAAVYNNGYIELLMRACGVTVCWWSTCRTSVRSIIRRRRYIVHREMDETLQGLCTHRRFSQRKRKCSVWDANFCRTRTTLTIR